MGVIGMAPPMAPLTQADIAPGLIGMLQPGMIIPCGKASADAGFLPCDGTFVSQASYAALFTAIAHTWNGGTDPGDGTFKLPNFQGRTPVGKNGATFANIGDTGGAETHTLNVTEIPAHGHQPQTKHISPAGGETVNAGPGYAYSDTAANARPYGANTGNTGGDAAHNNLQPYAVVLFQIKY